MHPGTKVSAQQHPSPVSNCCRVVFMVFEQREGRRNPESTSPATAVAATRSIVEIQVTIRRDVFLQQRGCQTGVAIFAAGERRGDNVCRISKLQKVNPAGHRLAPPLFLEDRQKRLKLHHHCVIGMTFTESAVSGTVWQHLIHQRIILKLQQPHLAKLCSNAASEIHTLAKFRVGEPFH